MTNRYLRLIPLLALLILLPACLRASAHPGRTDANGGHYDRSTGEYHYHHGYPAHQHENGSCPYDYDDKTGSRSGSSSGTRSTPGTNAENTTEPTSSVETTKSYVAIKSKKKAPTVGAGFYIFIVLFGIVALFCIVVFIIPLAISTLEFIFVEPFIYLYNKVKKRR